MQEIPLWKFSIFSNLYNFFRFHTHSKANIYKYFHTKVSSSFSKVIFLIELSFYLEIAFPLEHFFRFKMIFLFCFVVSFRSFEELELETKKYRERERGGEKRWTQKVLFPVFSWRFFGWSRNTKKANKHTSSLFSCFDIKRQQ